MKLSSIILSRVIGYVETFDLSPKGKVFFPDIIQPIIARYEFQKFPTTFEQFDEQKGIEFLAGKSGDTAIQKFVIFNSVLILETRAGTDETKRILEEMLTWAAKQFGLNYRPGMIQRFGYISDVTFHSDVPLLVPCSSIQNLLGNLNHELPRVWQEEIKYEGLQIQLGHDPLLRKYGLTPFTLTRRAEAKFSENKYFSEAPLPTDIHLQVLEAYEREVAASLAPVSEVRHAG